jgi:hypothetical protein
MNFLLIKCPITHKQEQKKIDDRLKYQNFVQATASSKERKKVFDREEGQSRASEKKHKQAIKLDRILSRLTC